MFSSSPQNLFTDIFTFLQSRILEPKDRSDIHLHYYALGDTERSFKGQVKGTRPEGEQCLANVVTEHLVSAIFF